MTVLIDDITTVTYKPLSNNKIQVVVDYKIDGKPYQIVSIPYETLEQAEACAHWIREQAFEHALEAFRVLIEKDLTQLSRDNPHRVTIH